MRALRLALLLALMAYASLPSLAQTPCSLGLADDYPCSQVDLLAHLGFQALGFNYDFQNGVRGNDIWGWTDPETGAEYALVGHYEGVAFVDLADPTAPVHVGTLPTARPGERGNLWRDVKTRGPYAFVVSEARDHGMQVFDLRRLRDVTSPPVTFEPDARYTGAGGVHNVVTDDDLDVVALVGHTSGAYACNGGGLHLVDVSTPTAPTFAGCFDDDGYTHDAQCIVYDGPDPDYTGRTVCFSSNARYVSISDVTDPANPVGISIGVYDSPSYTHQGWLTEDRRFLLLNDELDEANRTVAGTRTIVMNVEDLDNPQVAGAYISDVLTIDHNHYVHDGLLFQANYESGLRLFRFNPDAPADLEPVGFFDTYPESDAVTFNGAWSVYPFFESGVVVVGDRERGLFVLQPHVTRTASEGDAPEVALGLSAAYPNPFRTRATLDLALEAPEHVRAEVFDLLGRRVATLLDGLAGTAERLTLDGTGLPAGTYVVRVTGATVAETRRVTLIR